MSGLGKRLLTYAKGLPYRKIIGISDTLKKILIPKEWPEDVDSVHFDGSADELEEHLRAMHFEGAYLSFHFEGQVLDLRRPEGVDDEGRQMELHIRARPHPEKRGLQVIAHWELSRYEHKSGHINSEKVVYIDEEAIEDVIGGEPYHDEGGVVYPW